MKTRPKFGFTKYTDTALAAKAQLICDSLNGNLSFPNLPIGIPVLQSKITQFSDAITSALYHDKLRISERQKIREELEEMLRLNSGYVQSVTSEKSMIESSGYDAVVRNGQKPVLEPAFGLVAETAGTPGSTTVTVSWKQSGKANCFVLQYASGNPSLPETPWEVAAIVTKTKYTVTTGLKSGNYYSFRIISVNSSGLSSPSAAVTKIIG